MFNAVANLFAKFVSKVHKLVGAAFVEDPGDDFVVHCRAVHLQDGELAEGGDPCGGDDDAGVIG